MANEDANRCNHGRTRMHVKPRMNRCAKALQVVLWVLFVASQCVLRVKAGYPPSVRHLIQLITQPWSESTRPANPTPRDRKDIHSAILRDLGLSRETDCLLTVEIKSHLSTSNNNSQHTLVAAGSKNATSHLDHHSPLPHGVFATAKKFPLNRCRFSTLSVESDEVDKAAQKSGSDKATLSSLVQKKTATLPKIFVVRRRPKSRRLAPRLLGTQRPRVPRPAGTICTHSTNDAAPNSQQANSELGTERLRWGLALSQTLRLLVCSAFLCSLRPVSFKLDRTASFMSRQSLPAHDTARVDPRQASTSVLDPCQASTPGAAPSQAADTAWMRASLPGFLAAFRSSGWFADTEPAHGPQNAFAALVCAGRGRKVDGSAPQPVEKRKQQEGELPTLLGAFLDELASVRRQNSRAVLAFHNAKYDVRELASLVFAQSLLFRRKHREGIDALHELRYVCTLDMAKALRLEKRCSNGLTLQHLLADWCEADSSMQQHTALQDAVDLRKWFITVALDARRTAGLEQYLQAIDGGNSFQQVATLSAVGMPEIELVGSGERLSRPVRESTKGIVHTRSCSALKLLDIAEIASLSAEATPRQTWTHFCPICSAQDPSPRSSSAVAPKAEPPAPSPRRGVVKGRIVAWPGRQPSSVVHKWCRSEATNRKVLCPTLTRTRPENLREVDVSQPGFRGCMKCWVGAQSGPTSRLLQ